LPLLTYLCVDFQRVPDIEWFRAITSEGAGGRVCRLLIGASFTRY